MLFNRKATLTIGKYQQEGLSLSGFRISFSVVKTETDEPNNATIEVSNLAQNTRNKIKIGDENQVVLHAGYSDEGETSILFIGDITNTYNSVNPPNVTTVIEANDGGEVINRKTVKLSFNEGASSDQILDKIIEQMGLPMQKGITLLDLPKMIFNQGFSFQGYGADAMNKITKELDLNWSVQNNQIKITKKKQSSNLVAIRLTSKTGLIGSPIRINDVDKDDPEKSFVGWEVTSLLQPKAEPGDIIEVESMDITPAAQFVITEVSHKGDTHGNEWTSKIKVRDL